MTTATIQMIPGEIGLGVASALREIAEGSQVDPLAADLPDRAAALWGTLRDGGWDEIGTPGAVEGEQLPLRDLLEVALAWGRHCPPVPLVASIGAKRWSAAAREHSGPVSFGVPSAHIPGAGLVPHGDFPGLRVLSAADGGRLLDADDGEVDAFAPTLRIGRGPVTQLPEDAVREALVLLSGEALGAARQMHDRAVAYARERRQFGQPIGQFQAVKHQLADAHTALEVAETALAWAAQGTEDPRRHVRLALGNARVAATTAIHVHGGMGFTWELGLHVPLRHVLATRDLVDGWLDGELDGEGA
jgi:alkylation response protein AidB-like acyl-CoA dehydrogenase